MVATSPLAWRPLTLRRLDGSLFRTANKLLSVSVMARAKEDSSLYMRMLDYISTCQHLGPLFGLLQMQLQYNYSSSLTNLSVNRSMCKGCVHLHVYLCAYVGLSFHPAFSMTESNSGRSLLADNPFLCRVVVLYLSKATSDIGGIKIPRAAPVIIFGGFMTFETTATYQESTPGQLRSVWDACGSRPWDQTTD